MRNASQPMNSTYMPCLRNSVEYSTTSSINFSGDLLYTSRSRNGLMAISTNAPSGWRSRQAFTSSSFTRHRGTILDFSPIPVRVLITSRSSAVAVSPGSMECTPRRSSAVAKSDIVDSHLGGRRNLCLNLRRKEIGRDPFVFREVRSFELNTERGLHHVVL